jgi:hypothetical protein
VIIYVSQEKDIQNAVVEKPVIPPSQPTKPTTADNLINFDDFLSANGSVPVIGQNPFNPFNQQPVNAAPTTPTWNTQPQVQQQQPKFQPQFTQTQVNPFGGNSVNPFGGDSFPSQNPIPAPSITNPQFDPFGGSSNPFGGPQQPQPSVVPKPSNDPFDFSIFNTAVPNTNQPNPFQSSSRPQSQQLPQPQPSSQPTTDDFSFAPALQPPPKIIFAPKSGTANAAPNPSAKASTVAPVKGNTSLSKATAAKYKGSIVDDLPSCPVCGVLFPKHFSNQQVNSHVDNCLNETALTGASVSGEEMKKQVPIPSSAPKDSDWTELFDLAKCDWYFGDINRTEAEKLLFKYVFTHEN